MEKKVVAVSVFFSLQNSEIEVDSEILMESDFDISKFSISIPAAFRRMRVPCKVRAIAAWLPDTVKSFKPNRDFNTLMQDIVCSFLSMLIVSVNDFQR